MIKFGHIKSKVLKKLEESYGSKKFKTNLKTVFTPIMENTTLKELYSLYEELETKTFNDKEVAGLYVEELSNILKTKTLEVQEELSKINESLKDVSVDENDLYNMIDVLSENDRLLNIENKVIARKGVIDHLMSEKTIESQPEKSVNENLLNAVLVNNFNIMFESSLDSNDKEVLKNILSLSTYDLNCEFNTIKENVIDKVNGIITEDTDMKSKLSEVKTQVLSMSPSKYNLYKLMDLDKGFS